MIDTLAQLAGQDVADRITSAPSPAIQEIAASWPGETLCQSARALGCVPNTGIAALIEEHRRRMTTAA